MSSSKSRKTVPSSPETPTKKVVKAVVSPPATPLRKGPRLAKVTSLTKALRKASVSKRPVIVWSSDEEAAEEGAAEEEADEEDGEEEAEEDEEVEEEEDEYVVPTKAPYAFIEGQLDLDGVAGSKKVSVRWTKSCRSMLIVSPVTCQKPKSTGRLRFETLYRDKAVSYSTPRCARCRKSNKPCIVSSAYFAEVDE